MNHISQKLRVLIWLNSEMTYFPSNFNPKFLMYKRTGPYYKKKISLIHCSSLVEIPTSITTITSLTSLDLSGCSSLVKLPDNIETFTEPNHINLSGCSSLVEIPSSIVNAKNLQKLDLSNCLSLVELPSSIGNAINLQKLDRSRCSSLLVSLPPLPEDCESLERLDCSFDNPDICLNFVNCFKLNQEARDLISLTPTNGYAVFPGTEVPQCFTYRSSGSSLTVKLIQKSLGISTKFKACIL
ncbi:unnamed protein product, partial [Brassica oleracea]